METMKSATSRAFSTMDSASDVANNVSRFRVGYKEHQQQYPE